MARFALALQGGVLLKKETLARMITPAEDARRASHRLRPRLVLGERGGRREAWHTGGQPQVSTVLYMQPDRRVAVALLANLEGIGPALLELARQLAAASTAR